MTSLPLPFNPEEVIPKRYSCRSYQPTPLSQEQIEEFNQFMKERSVGPFQNSCRFSLIPTQDVGTLDNKKLGTYGVIKGAPNFLAGAVKEGSMNLEDFGYSMEMALLYLTSVNLNSCWMGGTFNKSAFSKRIDLKEDEILPAVSPVGQSSDKINVVNSVFKWMAKSKKRKAWEELFFIEDFQHPIKEEEEIELHPILAMVRPAPSAVNGQPWRIVVQKNQAHFYLKRPSKLLHSLQAVDLQRIDMGIAMCHFEVTAYLHQMEGEWSLKQPEGIEIPKGMEYICSRSY